MDYHRTEGKGAKVVDIKVKTVVEVAVTLQIEVFQVMGMWDWRFKLYGDPDDAIGALEAETRFDTQADAIENIATVFTAADVSGRDEE